MWSKRNFIRQQGLPDPPAERCGAHYTALLFQPRVLAVAILIGIVLQSPAVFFILSGVLLWNVIAPSRNPFDLLYNRHAGAGPGGDPLPPAPGPRRFAQALAGTVSLFIGLSLAFDWTLSGIALQVFLTMAVLALVFGKFCFGSFLYHLIRGRAGYARRTLPWARGA